MKKGTKLKNAWKQTSAWGNIIYAFLGFLSCLAIGLLKFEELGGLLLPVSFISFLCFCYLLYREVTKTAITPDMIVPEVSVKKEEEGPKSRFKRSKKEEWELQEEFLPEDEEEDDDEYEYIYIEEDDEEE